MFWSLYIDNSIKKVTEGNDEWLYIQREALQTFASNQTQRHGLLHKPYPDHPVGGHEMVLNKKGDLFNCSLVLPLGSCFVVSGKLWQNISQLKLPLHQVWEVTCRSRKEVFHPYFLLYFYHDCFADINFAESRFEHSVRKRNPDYRFAHEPHTHEIVDPDVKINSYSEYLAWYDEYVYAKNNFFEFPSLRIREIKFNDQVYSFDIISSNYLDHRLVISDRFRDILLEHKIKDILIFDCLWPIQGMT